MATQRPGTINSAKTSFDIVETIVQLDGAGVTELATELGMPKSTVHNYLRTLEDAEYLINEGGTYRIGLRFLGFGEHVKDRLRIAEIAKPEIDKLAETTGELASLMVEEHGRGIYTYLESGDNAVYLDARPGKRTYLHQTALGKSLLANYPRERVDDVIDRHGLPRETEHTITDQEALYEELQRIRDRGYAIDSGERVSEMRCVATAIQPEGDNVPRGAISVSAPASRMQDEFFESVVPCAVTEAASVVEINLRFS